MRVPIDSNVRSKIGRELDEIERVDGVRILFACESGSRAWGFESTDSDYDVRFVYIRPPDWYLSIDIATRRDVIEKPIDACLDVSGWDIIKALNLYRQSNPPLYEWLGSPIVYCDQFSFAAELRDQRSDYYLPKAAAYHYMRMAQNNWLRYLQRSLVRTKKYLYALRPLLAVLWLERQLGVVPTRFTDLVEIVVDDGEVQSAIRDLLNRKQAGTELSESEPNPVLHNFISRHMARMEAIASEVAPEPRGNPETLNRIMRRCLREAWP